MRHKLSPPQILLFFFTGAILAGAVLLSLPMFQAPGTATVPLIDSLFMAASAVCVTGLATVDVAAQYSLAGQIVILILIQMGGLGYMLFATLTALFFGRLSMQDRMIINEVIDFSSYTGVRYLLLRIMGITFAIEAFGAIVLTMLLKYENYSIAKADYYGIFHSISAFCNCGLSLWGNSLESFSGNVPVLTIMMGLIVAGGIGYTVLVELVHIRQKINLSTHSLMVLYTSAFLIVSTALVFFVLDYSNSQTMQGFSFGKKVFTSVFMAVTSRTAGFNTITTAFISPAAILFLIPVMIIGASPASTGGGIKTTTFALMMASIKATLTMRKDVNIFSRRISDEAVRKAFTITILFLSVIAFMSIIISAIEDFGVLDVVFEVTSACATVGLSTGITAVLSPFSKLLIVITMIIGRLGPLTVGLATIINQEETPYKYAEGKILIG